MLGRLFKLKSLLNVVGENSPSQTQSRPGELSEATTNPVSASTQTPDGAHNNGNVNPNSYEDSYTREILYGLLELALHPLPFNPRRFRLVVSQDGGNLRSKQVLYDSANESLTVPALRTKPPLSSNGLAPLITNSSSDLSTPQSASSSLSSRLPTSANTLRGSTIKSTHNINDLNDYMFGRGLPSVERHTSTKIHMLPPLNLLVHSDSRAVLLTKLFLISDTVPGNNDLDTLIDPHWAPCATFPSKDTVFQVSITSGKPHDQPVLLPRVCLFSSRFSVGVIIPLEDPNQTVEEVLSSNWETLSHYLIVLQKLVCKKLTIALKNSMVSNTSPYINNKRILFPSGVLQQEADFGHQLQKLIKLVHYNVNTPRLVNINAFMTYSLNHVDSNLKTNVMNWALEVINWLEFKDGKSFVPFQAQGSAIPQMHSQNSYLLHSSSSAPSWYRSNETPVTSNTFLASLFALILPLRDLLSQGPLHVDPNSLSNSKSVTRIVVMTSNSSVAKKLIFILSGLIPDAEFLLRLEREDSNGINYDSTGKHFKNSGEKTLSGSSENKTLSKDGLPANLEGGFLESSHDGGISFTTNLISTKPIPIRSSLLASELHSDDSTSVSVSSTKGWDVPHKSGTSLSLYVQKNVLESTNVTVAQQIPTARRISASNSSSMAYLSSSLNSSLSSSASNYSLSRLGSSFMDRWRNSLVGSNKLYPNFVSETLDGAITSESLNMRPAFSTTKSPSPADEIDEPIWEDSYSANSASSPAKQKCSRTQSLLNLFNGSPTKKSGLATSTLGMDRTRSSIYIPPMNNEGTDAEEKNLKIIKGKVQALMRDKLHLYSDGEHRIVVDCIEKISPRIKEGEPLSNFERLSKELDDACLQKLHKKAFLQPNVAFVDEFRPEYTIQSCPVNPRLEAQVSNAMKNDLLFYQNNCGFEKVSSKTVYISLRAREIKLIEMSVGNQKQRSYFGKGNIPTVSPAPLVDSGQSYFSNMTPSSPGKSYFNGDHVHPSYDKRDLPSGNSFRTTVKKVYTPSRNCGDKEAIQQVEGQLEKLNEVATLINSNSADSPETKDLYNRMLFNAVRELII